MKIENLQPIPPDLYSPGQNEPSANRPDGLPHYDSLVKYEFNTHDKDGNKVMDKLTREETLDMMDSVRKQYGDNVIVEFSGDALYNLIKDQLGPDGKLVQEKYDQYLEERKILIKDLIEPANKLKRLIPNLQTQYALDKSLENADQKIKDAADSIIFNDFLPSRIGDMTEEERQEAISLGMEKAKFLARNYLSGDQAESFMQVMETIAKYGMNGKVGEDGIIRYDIRKGPVGSMPDDSLPMSDLMKTLAPDTYAKFNSMLTQATETNDTALLGKAWKMAIKWDMNMQENEPDQIQELIDDYRSWKQTMADTPLNGTYKDSDTSGIQSFMDSILRQNGSLNRDYLMKNLDAFAAGLG